MGAVIYEDTRNKVGAHELKNGWWRAHGVEVVRKKLDAGDYARDGSNVLVDTKKDVQELVMDIGRDHARFSREVERAERAGCRLVILVEQHQEFRDRRKLAAWRSTVCGRCRVRGCDPTSDRCRAHRFKPMQGATAAKIIETMEREHLVRFRFCNRRDTARVICEMLGVEYERI